MALHAYRGVTLNWRSTTQIEVIWNGDRFLTDSHPAAMRMVDELLARLDLGPPQAADDPHNLYARDGLCHNAEPGTYGHECGKPAVWLGQGTSGSWVGYCDDCRQRGYEARSCVAWQRHPRLESIPA